MPYQRRVLITLLGVVGASCGILLLLSQRSAGSIAFRLMQDKVLAIAASTAPQIDGEQHEHIRQQEDEAGPDYGAIRRVLRATHDANQSSALPVTFVYTLRPSTGEGWEYVVDAAEEGPEKSHVGDPVEFREASERPRLEEARVDDAFAEDSFGTWLSAFAPIKNRQGRIVALVGVDVEARAVLAQLGQLLHGGLIALGLALLVAAAASIVLANRVTAPLKVLRTHVAAMGEGDLTTRVPVTTRDEFGDLGAEINRMAAGLQEREALKGALVRYVSSQATDAVVEEKAENETGEERRRVTVLVADIRHFTALSQSLPPDRVFAFLNEYFSTFIDIILRHRGTLDRSVGDSVTALFGAPLEDQDQERHAVEASLAMQRRLAEFRERWTLPGDLPVALDIGIHTGEALVVRVGHDRRMDFASLGETVTVVSLIKSLPQTAGAGIVVSETTAKGLRNALPLGRLGEVSVAGSDRPLALFTVDMPLPGA